MTRRPAPAVRVGPRPAGEPTKSDDELMLEAIEEAQRDRARLAISVAVDGIGLADSRSVEDASHEVRVRDGLTVTCSCWQFRKGHPCPHWCWCELRLWEEQLGADLSDTPALALVTTLRNRWLSIPPRYREKTWLQPSIGPNCPEETHTGREPATI